MATVKYPNVSVQLSGEDGNAFMMISRVATALRRASVPADEVAEFQNEAMSGNYDHVLQTILKTVEVR